VNTTAAASMASPAESPVSATMAGALSAASASGPPNEATATPMNAHGPIGRSTEDWIGGPGFLKRSNALLPVFVAGTGRPL
jgi:hypothetical protein